RGAGSWPVRGLVARVWEAWGGGGGFLGPPFGCRGAGRADQVPGLDGAVPAAQPVQALFLLIQLRQRQLALGGLTSQLGLVLPAVGQELPPLGLALGAKQLLQLGGAGLLLGARQSHRPAPRRSDRPAP